jgi:hypothetical protein
MPKLCAKEGTFAMHAFGDRAGNGVAVKTDWLTLLTAKLDSTPPLVR